ncbi:MAG: methylated-DNA--[protein]-cysteine S-methyltransferase [Chloroflexota bacterium]
MRSEIPDEQIVVIGAVKTSLGEFGVALTHCGVARLTFPSDPLAACEQWAARWLPDARIVRHEKYLQHVARELAAYCDGELRDFAMPLDLRGTAFQLSVWQAVRRIAYGQTQSYTHIAQQIGQPNAVRAVGAANGANPVPIIVPCHRIIGSNGKLVGYGGGIALKHRLLQLEGVML